MNEYDLFEYLDSTAQKPQVKNRIITVILVVALTGAVYYYLNQ